MRTEEEIEKVRDKLHAELMVMPIGSIGNISDEAWRHIIVVCEMDALNFALGEVGEVVLATKERSD